MQSRMIHESFLSLPSASHACPDTSPTMPASRDASLSASHARRLVNAGWSRIPTIMYSMYEAAFRLGGERGRATFLG
ncbi:hypothetical protein LY78DRAFT_420968 [Colletotrichum sublineola]|nr:hypothetical protein LY78DRAFT_420968 [Colletotrichum sublineola]